MGLPSLSARRMVTVTSLSVRSAGKYKKSALSIELAPCTVGCSTGPGGSVYRTSLGTMCATGLPDASCGESGVTQNRSMPLPLLCDPVPWFHRGLPSRPARRDGKARWPPLSLFAVLRYEAFSLAKCDLRIDAHCGWSGEWARKLEVVRIHPHLYKPVFTGRVHVTVSLQRRDVIGAGQAVLRWRCRCAGGPAEESG